jgi:hypothetical protein
VVASNALQPASAAFLRSSQSSVLLITIIHHSVLRGWVTIGNALGGGKSGARRPRIRRIGYCYAPPFDNSASADSAI